MPRSVRPIDEQLLSTLPTARLLAYRDRLLSLEEAPESSDCELAEIEGLDPVRVWFKSDVRWRKLYDQVLATLDEREDVKS